jgi:hypothetical protein
MLMKIQWYGMVLGSASGPLNLLDGSILSLLIIAMLLSDLASEALRHAMLTEIQ